MRLLLLLSALLSALTGAVSARSQAQVPVSATAGAAQAGAALLASRPAALPFSLLLAGHISPVALPSPARLVPAFVARRLFAERRRE